MIIESTSNLASPADILRRASRVPSPRTPKNVCGGGYVKPVSMRNKDKAALVSCTKTNSAELVWPESFLGTLDADVRVKRVLVGFVLYKPFKKDAL